MTALARPASGPALAGVVGGCAAIGALAAVEPVLALVLMVALAAGALLVAWPDCATLIVVFLYVANVPAVLVKYHGAPVIIGVVIPLLLVVPVAHRLYRGERVIVTRVLVLLVLFLLTQVLATLFSDFQSIAWENVKTFLVEGVLFYFLLTNAIRTPAMLRLATRSVLLAGALMGGLSIFQEVTGTYSRPYGGFAQVGRDFFVGASAEARLAGPIGDPNYYAQVLLIVVPIGIFSISTERGLMRLLAAAGTVVATAAAAMTFSRGAGVAFLLLFLLMAFLRYIRWYQVVAIVAGVILLLTVVPAYKDRVATLGSAGAAASGGASGRGADESVRSRATEMLAATLVFADNPVLGVGPGVFPSYYQEYAQRVGLELRETVRFGVRKGEAAQRESHNLFLSIAADLGVLGLLLFLTIVGVTVWELSRARRRLLRPRPDLARAVTGMLLAVIAYLTTGLFLTLAFERYFWLLMGLAGAAALVARRTEAEAASRSASGTAPAHELGAQLAPEPRQLVESRHEVPEPAT